MRLLPKTWALAVIALVLVAFNVLGRGGSGYEDLLPHIDAIEADNATRIEITSVTEKMILEREGPESWKVTAPFIYPADTALVNNVLSVYEEDIPMDVQVDSGNDDTYGLDASNGIVVEIWTSADLPAVSLIVGYDSVGGSSFVRVSGDENVYRARVGGRQRYEIKPTGWRNRSLISTTPERITGIEVESAAGTTSLVREPTIATEEGVVPEPGDWMLEPDPGWEVDQKAVNMLVANLARLRAVDILDPDFEGGFSPPAGRAVVVLDDGTEHKIIIGGRTAAGAAYIKTEGRDEVFKIPADIVALLLRAPDDYRDKTLVQLNPAEIETLFFEEGRMTVVIRQDLATRGWRVEQPQNIDIDPKFLQFGLRTLTNLRATGIAEDVDVGRAGLQRARYRIGVNFFDGTSTAIEVGSPVPDQEGFTYVRRVGAPTVHILNDKVLEGLRRAFGR